MAEDGLQKWLKEKDTVKFESLASSKIENAMKSSNQMKICENDSQIHIKGLLFDIRLSCALVNRKNSLRVIQSYLHGTIFH